MASSRCCWRSQHLSEIARGVGISKSTASYHMKELVNRGIAEIIDVKNVKGGVYTKTFALRRGVIVVSEPYATEGGVERSLAEHYLNLKMSWPSDPSPENIIFYLYRVLLSLSGAGREVIELTLVRYGRLFGGEVVSPLIKSKALALELREITRWLEKTGCATCSVIPSEEGERLIACSSFFRASETDSPAFKFLQGIVEGFLAERHGARYLVEAKYPTGGPPEIVVGRRKGFP
jgi:DNA-binding Lrp family transcriptional regulator